jgi:ABC-type transport system involved in multi-copper enzyme maturation permease subunit
LIDHEHPPEPAAPQDVWFEALVRPTHLIRYIWPYESSLAFGAVPLSAFWQLTPTKVPAPPLGHQVYILEEILVHSLGSWVTILLSILATAFFIPSMMQKGTLDLLLVKPLERWRLLIYKYLGGLGFIGLNASFAIVGLWLVIGLRTGIWCHALLVLIPVITFCFAILYSVSTLVAILTHSSVVAILISCLVWALLFGIDTARTRIREQYAPPGMLHVSAVAEPADLGLAVLDVIHFVLPRTHDLGVLTSEVLGNDLLPEVRLSAVQDTHTWRDWLESLSVSLVFIAVMLALACLRFCTKDY